MTSHLKKKNCKVIFPYYMFFFASVNIPNIFPYIYGKKVSLFFSPFFRFSINKQKNHTHTKKSSTVNINFEILKKRHKIRFSLLLSLSISYT